MEESKKNQILLALNGKVDQLSLAGVKNKLDRLEDSNYEVLLAQVSQLKDPTTVLILSILLGGLGVDRFMLGQVGVGICKLLFGWLTFGIWWLIDVIKAKKMTMEYNGQQLNMAIMAL